MKFPLSLLAILFAFNFVYAQNTNPWPSSGNIGISTTSPLSPLTIGSNTSTMLSTAGITLGVGQNNIEFLNSVFGSGFAAKIYGVDSGSGITTLRIATRGNSTTWKDALTVMASASGNGNVGIGTTSPSHTLEINGVTSLNSNGSGFLQKSVTGTSSTYAVFSNTGGNLYLGVDQSSGGNIIAGTSAYAAVVGTAGSTALQLTTNNTVRMTVDQSGNIAIGATDPQGHKLAVNGDIVATNVTVKSHNNWPDYVFKPEYSLPSLSEVKTYIDHNQHLPDIPSASTIEKDGQDIGEMNKMLLKKVEELTLYLIQKDKEIMDQGKEIDLLKSQVAKLLGQ